MRNIYPLFQKNRIPISVILGGVCLWAVAGCTIEPVKSVPTLIPTIEDTHVQDGKMITLSIREPQQRVKTNLDLLASKPTRLIVTTTQIDNKAQIEFAIGVYLSATSGNDEDRVTEQRRLGSFGIYPPGQTGDYVFYVPDDISELQSSLIDSDLSVEWAVELELEVFHEGNVEGSLEVHIASVEWE